MSLLKIDHIALTVKDMIQSKEFYTKLMIATLNYQVKDDTADFFAIDCDGFLLEFWAEDPIFSEDTFNRYRVGLHHFGMQLENKAQVDLVYQKLIEINAVILDPPTYYPNYAEGYYALYFLDPNGFKMEFLCYDQL